MLSPPPGVCSLLSHALFVESCLSALGLYLALFPYSQSISFSSISQGGGTQNSVGKALCRTDRDQQCFDHSSGTAEHHWYNHLGAGCGSVSFGKCCPVTTALPVLISVERAGLLLLPDTPTGSSASHFSLYLYFLLTVQSEILILILKGPYERVGCSPSCSAMRSLLSWGNFCSSGQRRQFVTHYPKCCYSHVKCNWDIHAKMKAITSYTPRCKESLNCEGFFYLQPAPSA